MRQSASFPASSGPLRGWKTAVSFTDAAHVHMASGFVPGKVYQVIYTTTGAPIVGCGLLATRDMGSFLKYGSAREGNPCAGDLQYAYSFGVSQSGRFLRHFLYLGLNQDEHDRTVFDGLIPHVAGGKHGEFNHRFAQPSSQASRSPNNLSPYSDAEQTDPETSRTGGLLSRLAAKGTMPKVMHTYTSSEYWGGHGALVHIDVTGSRDLEYQSPSAFTTSVGRSILWAPSHRRILMHGKIPWPAPLQLDRLSAAATRRAGQPVSLGDARGAPPSHPRLDNGTAVPQSSSLPPSVPPWSQLARTLATLRAP